MKDVGLDDFYEVRKMGLVSDIDRLSLIDLYQPLIGARASATYLTLLEDPTKDDGGLVLTHDKLFNKLVLSPGEFFHSVEALEAVGLLRTFFKEDKGIRYFVYSLYSPKDPAAFFNDELLTGTLKRRIDESTFELLLEKYKQSNLVQGFDEITKSFNTYFDPDFDDMVYKGRLRYEASGRKTAKVKTDFNLSDFLKEISKSGISEKDFSLSEMREIENIATLYSVPGSEMGEVVSTHYVYANFIGQRCDFDRIRYDCRQLLRFPYIRKTFGEKTNITSETNMAKKIRLMDENSPIDWLTLMQNGRKPADSDIKIIENLSHSIGLPDPVINALVDFVLQKNNNMLWKSSTEKFGAALAREGVKTSLDAMDYLKKIDLQLHSSKERVYQKHFSSFARTTKDNTENNTDQTKKEAIGFETAYATMTDEEALAAIDKYFKEKKD